MSGLPPEEIESRIDDLIKTNEALMKQNQLLSAFLGRHTAANNIDPESLIGSSATLSESDLLVVAIAELEATRADFESARDRGLDLACSIKGLVDVARQSIATTRKATYEFRRDVLRLTGPVAPPPVADGAAQPNDPIPTFPPAPAVDTRDVRRFLAAQLANSERTGERMALKAKMLRSDLARTQVQLSQREEAGESLHVIDFDQLKIENQQALRRIEDKNSELLKLKLTSGNALQVLTGLRTRLVELSEEAAWLSTETRSRRAMLEKLAAETGLVEKQLTQAQAERRQLRQPNAAGSVTGGSKQVMSYVETRAREQQLTKALADWERKVQLMEMQAARLGIR